MPKSIKIIDYTLPLIYNKAKKRGKNMSEIYLTKIERKTIFTKSLIFVLVVFIISDLTVTGPFWFNFIPWLYILGLVGSIKKIDSVLISWISTFTVFISSLLSQGQVDAICIITTLISLVTLVCGIITGKFIYQFILEHRLVKYIKRSTKITYILLAILMLIFSYVIMALIKGNVITYIKSRNNLKQYIEDTYDITDYTIVSADFWWTLPGKYSHTVQIADQRVNFVPVTKTIFKDSNKDSRYITMQHNLEHEIGGKVDEITKKYTYLENARIMFNLEYNKVAIKPNVIVLNIKCNNVDTDNLDELYKQIANFVQEVQSVKQMQKVTITIDETTLQISNEQISNISAEYIKDGLDIEEIIE